MYSLDTVVYHTKNVFVKKVILDVKKTGHLSKLTVILHGG